MANIILGVVFITFGLWGLSIWWWSVVEVVRGLAPVAAVLFGLVAIGAGISRLREHTSHDDELDDENDLEPVAPAAGQQTEGQT